MSDIMATGFFRLKGLQLYGKGIATRKIRNVKEVAERSGLTYTTAHRWVNRSDEIEKVNLENLANFLIDGLGLSPQEIERMPFGDIFEFIPFPEAKSE